MVSSIITAITTAGLILYHAGIVSYSSSRASEWLIINVNGLNTMTTCIYKLVIFPHNDYPELIGWHDDFFTTDP